ncbi:uncharacterized protein FIBRA_00441 [Fibroporia radiculosa]|uniref:Rab-GAP TBC domain-containing protein n=1 Tax=Fibroporia radiculosa TaxID=599839 RepID=J4H000_9APHY|nr:uncharacterized protein FIBRA_00441 [Fibroporia radiculosa]CCL98444.1 predicted protein [Fibroporia radiculosa]
MAVWEPTRMKSQLRLTAQKLGQLQDKMDAQSQVTRRDIAILLQRGNIALARVKARKLMSAGILEDLLQTLEMHVGVVLGHLSEFDRSQALSPVLLEACASIVAAAPQVDSKELRVVQELLVLRLGSDFVRIINNHISKRVKAALLARPPSAQEADQYLYTIAQAHGVQWLPDLQPNEKLNAISEILDPSSATLIDVTSLRILCSHGLPDHPSWLRPRVWKLLLGVLPQDKMRWNEQNRKNRENYYDLVRRLLEPFSRLSAPTSPFGSLDASLVNVSKELSQVPPKLMVGLQEAPEASSLCPFDDTAADEFKIPHANNLDSRLRVIREIDAEVAVSSKETEDDHSKSTPEIRLDEPEIASNQQNMEQSESTGSVTQPPSDSLSSTRSAVSTTLLPSRSLSAHHRHVSSLLRLLYVHSCLNPANQSPHIASLLVPLYSTLLAEVAPEDAAHVEADTFWVFESLVGEFADLNDVDGGNIWARKFSERLCWADADLADDLQTKGLDPALPHYSFRWLVPLLSHTLPLPSLLTIWDALFSRPMRERDDNPKLSYLIDICTSMLLCTRRILLRLGTPGPQMTNVWSEEVPSTTLSSRVLEDAFAEGMIFLQQCPIEAAGGIDVVLQTAYDLTLQRQAEATATQMNAGGLGARLRDTVWRGFAGHPTIVESQDEDDDDDDDDPDSTATEDDMPTAPRTTSMTSTLTARFADTVWRGISNEAAMEAPPSPTTPVTPLAPSPEPRAKPLPEMPSEDESKADSSSSARTSLWGYAEKLKDSDAAATLAKVSTNWRMKALDAWSKRSSGSSSTFLSPAAAVRPSSMDLETKRASLTEESQSRHVNDKRRGGSLPAIDRSDAYSPPARPAYFRPPRDSMVFTGSRSPLSPSNGEISPSSDTGSIGSAGFRSSMSFKSPDSSKSTSKSGPRPLLLNSASLMTSGHSRSPTVTPISGGSDRAWADSIRAKHSSPIRRDSQSSVSSISPSDPRIRSRTGARADLESETAISRIVPLRSARSPITVGSKRVTPTSSTTSSPPPRVHRRMGTDTSMMSTSDDGQNGRSRGYQSQPESPATGPSPPPPRTPDAFSPTTPDVKVNTQGPRPESMDFSDINESGSNKPTGGLQHQPKAYQLPRLSVGGDTSDSSGTQAPPRSPHSKIRRMPPRVNTRSKDSSRAESGTGQNTLSAERSDDPDAATTPRALSFETTVFPTTPVSQRATRRARKTSGNDIDETPTRKMPGDGREPRARKVSADGHSVKSRKMSGERARHNRDISAADGDDEGYNDLLSAYESEENTN